MTSAPSAPRAAAICARARSSACAKRCGCTGFVRRFRARTPKFALARLPCSRSPCEISIARSGPKPPRKLLRLGLRFGSTRRAKKPGRYRATPLRIELGADGRAGGQGSQARDDAVEQGAGGVAAVALADHQHAGALTNGDEQQPSADRCAVDLPDTLFGLANGGRRAARRRRSRCTSRRSASRRSLPR